MDRNHTVSEPFFVSDRLIGRIKSFDKISLSLDKDKDKMKQFSKGDLVQFKNQNLIFYEYCILEHKYECLNDPNAYKWVFITSFCIVFDGLEFKKIKFFDRESLIQVQKLSDLINEESFKI